MKNNSGGVYWSSSIIKKKYCSYALPSPLSKYSFEISIYFVLWLIYHDDKLDWGYNIVLVKAKY